LAEALQRGETAAGLDLAPAEGTGTACGEAGTASGAGAEGSADRVVDRGFEGFTTANCIAGERNQTGGWHPELMGCGPLPGSSSFVDLLQLLAFPGLVEESRIPGHLGSHAP
jgi:hypothetical protein